ncbi:MAG: aminopeptidase [Akkermansiaceae bacterium]|nr:aminopeptidase [Akkermansiaceae bacterium]
MKTARIAFLGIFALFVLPSCQTIQFYGQAVRGQMEIFQKSRPNEKVIADPASSPVLKKQLSEIQKIRRFASEHLSLPGNDSYGKYSDLGRKHVVWVLYAAPEFSLEPKTWRYPLIGEISYRGYFREQDTVAMADQLRREKYDVFIGGVDAYSTLGWFHDPILNTFVGYPDIDLAETIFHELTHRKLFRRGDIDFNESLANTVAEEGVRRWLKHQGRAADLKKYEGRLVRRREFYREIEKAKISLEMLYASGEAEAEMRSQKKEILSNLRDQFRELRRRWGGRGLDSWLKEDIHNGHIVSLKIYSEKMPVFQKLLIDCYGDLELFFAKAEKLKFPPIDRIQ